MSAEQERIIATEIGYTKAEKVAALRAAQQTGGSPRLFTMTPASQDAFEDWTEPVQLRLRDRGDGCYQLLARSLVVWTHEEGEPERIGEGFGSLDPETVERLRTEHGIEFPRWRPTISKERSED